MSTGAPSPQDRVAWDSAETYWLSTIPSIEAICGKIAANLQSEIQYAIENSSYFGFTLNTVIEEQNNELGKEIRPLDQENEKSSGKRYKLVAAPPKMRYTLISETEPVEYRIEVKIYFSMLDDSVKTESLSYAKRLDHLAICKRRTLGKVVVISTGRVRIEGLKVIDGVEDINSTYEEYHGLETGSMSAPTASSPEVSIRTTSTDGTSVSSQQPQSFGDLGGSLPPSMESDPFNGTTSASQSQGSRRP